MEFGNFLVIGNWNLVIMHTIKKILLISNDKLKHLEVPHLDSEVLLSYVIDKSREYILSHPNETVEEDKIKQFNDLVTRRVNHEPIAYLIQKKEFYGRNFYINENVHIPRPATEDLIDEIKQKIPNNFTGTIADIGTGSGIIAITLAFELPEAKIIATDVSDKALDIARQNASDLNVSNRITFLQGDLLSSLQNPVDIIAANLPYGWLAIRSSSRSEGWTQDKETLHQPKLVYDGGKDGLDLIKKLITQLPKYLTKNGQTFLEFDPRQSKLLKKILSKTSFDYNIIKDTENFDRILYLKNLKNEL